MNKEKLFDLLGLIFAVLVVLCVLVAIGTLPR